MITDTKMQLQLLFSWGASAMCALRRIDIENEDEAEVAAFRCAWTELEAAVDGRAELRSAEQVVLQPMIDAWRTLSARGEAAPYTEAEWRTEILPMAEKLPVFEYEIPTEAELDQLFEPELVF